MVSGVGGRFRDIRIAEGLWRRLAAPFRGAGGMISPSF
jgi:hypothetical protein